MVRDTSARQTGLLALIFCLLAGAAEAKRIYYESEGRTYWYELSDQAAQDREAAQAAARILQERVTQDQAAQNGAVQVGPAPQLSPAAAEPRPGEATGAVPDEAARPDRRAGRSARAGRATEIRHRERTNAPRSKAAERPVRAAQARPARPPSVPSRPEAGPTAVDANLQAATPQPETTGSVEAPSSWPELPVPPAPSVVDTVTYDFKTGLKRTVLRDGTVYQDSFDPKAFFRFGAASSGTGAPAVATPHLGQGQTQPEQN